MVLYSTRLDGTEQRWIVDFNPRGGRLRLRAITEEQGTALEVTDRVSFNVLGGRAPTKSKQEDVKVVAVTLKGELPVPPEQLLKAGGLKAGRRYNALRLEQAADRVRKKLVDGGWRAASVDATWAVAKGHERSVEVVLNVDAGPLVLLSWTGDDPGAKVRSQAREAWPAYASPEAASAAVARAARIALRAQGYYGAKVEHEVRVVEGRAELRAHRGARGEGHRHRRGVRRQRGGERRGAARHFAEARHGGLLRGARGPQQPHHRRGAARLRAHRLPAGTHRAAAAGVRREDRPAAGDRAGAGADRLDRQRRPAAAGGARGRQRGPGADAPAGRAVRRHALPGRSRRDRPLVPRVRLDRGAAARRAAADGHGRRRALPGDPRPAAAGERGARRDRGPAQGATCCATRSCSSRAS